MKRNTGIEASAGCGKTTRIVDEVMEGLKAGDFQVDNMVVITYTRDAAAELRARVMDRMRHELQKGTTELKAQWENLGNARISTIHSFCESLLKERPLEAGIDPGFTIMEQEEAEAFAEQAYSRWIEAVMEDKDARKHLALLAVEHGVPLYRDPNNSFRNDAAFWTVTEKYLNHRELALCMPTPPENDIETLRSEFFRWADQQAEKCKNVPMLHDIIADYIRTLRQAACNNGDAGYLSAIQKNKCLLRTNGGKDWKGFRDEWKERCAAHIAKATYAAYYPQIEALYGAANELLPQFVAHYRKAMQQAGVLDFTEILIKTRELLAQNRDIRTYFKQKFQFFLVDEFQDTDPIQAEILFFLCEQDEQYASDWKDVKLAQGKIFAVGDPKQSIFGFRRADIEIYREVMQRIVTSEGASGTLGSLDHNYRCGPAIIEWVNDFFRKRLICPEGEAYQADYSELTAGKEHESAVQILQPDLDDEQAVAVEAQTVGPARQMEAAMTASWIAQHCREEKKFRYSDVMLLFRKNRNVETTADHLEEAGIPYEVVGGQTFFGRQEVLDIANLLATIADPTDSARLLAVLKGPFFSLSDAQLFDWRMSNGGRYFDYRSDLKDDEHAVAVALSELKSLHEEAIRDNTLAHRIVQRLVEQKDLLASWKAGYRGTRRMRNVIKTIEYLKTLRHLPFCDAAWKLLANTESEVKMGDFSPHGTQADAVRLMTIHKSKGLQSPVVYLADGTSQNTQDSSTYVDNTHHTLTYSLPSKMLGAVGLKKLPLADAALKRDRLRDGAEAERLRYVAATRAQEQLLINHVPFKTQGSVFARLFTDTADEALVEKVPIRDLQNQPAVSLSVLSATITGESCESAFDRIRKSRQATIKELSQPSLRVARPSDITRPATSGPMNVTVLFDPTELQYVVKGTRATQVGTMVHQLLQHEPDDVELAAQRIIEAEHSNIAPNVLIERYNRIRTNVAPLLEDAQRVFKEVPIKFTAEDGQCFDGIIDLLVQASNGKWILVDYKTVHIEDGQAEHVRQVYEKQLNAYEEGLKQVGIVLSDKRVVAL